MRGWRALWWMMLVVGVLVTAGCAADDAGGEESGESEPATVESEEDADADDSSGEVTLAEAEQAALDEIGDGEVTCGMIAARRPLTLSADAGVMSSSEPPRPYRQRRPMTTLGSLSLCRSLLEAGLVDRFRVVVFPVVTGSTAASASTTATPTSPKT